MGIIGQPKSNYHEILIELTTNNFLSYCSAFLGRRYDSANEVGSNTMYPNNHPGEVKNTYSPGFSRITDYSAFIREGNGTNVVKK